MTKRLNSIKSLVLGFAVATVVLGATIGQASAAPSVSATRSIPTEDEPAITSIVQLFYETSDVNLTVLV
jgi:hypothetical protein